MKHEFHLIKAIFKMWTRRPKMAEELVEAKLTCSQNQTGITTKL